ncbi:hypothetical protein DV515_00009729, partial [Chloebia gouldiae]
MSLLSKAHSDGETGLVLPMKHRGWDFQEGITAHALGLLTGRLVKSGSENWSSMCLWQVTLLPWHEGCPGTPREGEEMADVQHLAGAPMTWEHKYLLSCLARTAVTHR